MKFHDFTGIELLPVVIDQIMDFVNGDLTDVEIVLMTKHRLEAPTPVL